MLHYCLIWHNFTGKERRSKRNSKSSWIHFNPPRGSKFPDLLYFILMTRLFIFTPIENHRNYMDFPVKPPS